MKSISTLLAAVLLLGVAGWAQGSRPADLDSTLRSMDKASAGLRTVEAEFQWDQFMRVVESHDFQSGKMYLNRGKKELEMSAVVQKPAPKQVLFKGSTVRVYEPRIDQVTVYDVGKNKADFQSYLVLGFGGSGQDLSKNFDVRYAGSEQLGGVNAAKLELVPKSEKVRATFSLITLWIDTDRGIAVQQRFQESSGDYRLATYSNIKLNQNLPGDIFTLKTTGRTKTVRPQGM